MIYSKRKFIFLGLFFLFVFFVHSFAIFAIEEEIINITDAKQLKGIWEALYIYQQIPKQKRIDTFRPPLPKKEEFESNNKYQERVEDIKMVYEKRVEENLKREIKNEQEFKNKVFTLKVTYTPYTSIQDSMKKYLSKTNEGIQEPLAEEYYEHKEKTTVLRKKIGTSGEDTTGATAYLGIPLASPPFSEWKIEENNYSLEEKRAYFTFSLGEYNMEKERFPIIFPLSQFTTEEKEWKYYIKKFSEGEHYAETFKKPNTETTEQWLIKFDELPTYLPLPLGKAETVRKNEKDLILEFLFRPVSATKKIGPRYTHYTLGIELISATFKDGEEVVYTGKSGEWKDQEFVALLPEIDEAGWTMQPKHFDNDPLDGVNDPGSPSNPWIVKPSDPKYGPTYEVSSKYDYGNYFSSRRDHYYGSLPAKVALSLFSTNITGAFFAPGQPANPYIVRRVDVEE